MLGFLRDPDECNGLLIARTPFFSKCHASLWQHNLLNKTTELLTHALSRLSRNCCAVLLHHIGAVVLLMRTVRPVLLTKLNTGQSEHGMVPHVVTNIGKQAALLHTRTELPAFTSQTENCPTGGPVSLVGKVLWCPRHSRRRANLLFVLISQYLAKLNRNPHLQLFARLMLYLVHQPVHALWSESHHY